MMRRVRLTGAMRCRTDEEAELVRQNLAEHVRLTRQEPGCIMFDITETANPLEWRVEEEFTDEQAFERHQIRISESAWGRATEGIEREYSVEIVTEESP